MEAFEGKVAAVTGAASGIGLALARRFAAEGMRVALGDIEAPALEEAVAAVGATGAEAFGFRLDVSDPAQMQGFADAVAERFGGCDVFCNNAGVGAGGLSWEMPLESWRWVLDVNLWGVVHGVRSFVPLLLEREEGHLVNTASIAGLVAAPYMGPYNASKHAVVAISETLHHELALVGGRVKVSVLCPGWVNTRIADSARNRPGHLAPPGEADAAGAELLQAMLASGMPPEEVAEQVLAAVRAGNFWILTHDADDQFVAAAERRARALLAREDPSMSFPA